jgi:hypothetical protein
VVARILLFRASESLVAGGPSNAAGARRRAPGTPLSSADARHGGRADHATLAGGGGLSAPLPLSRMLPRRWGPQPHAGGVARASEATVRPVERGGAPSNRWLR